MDEGGFTEVTTQSYCSKMKDAIVGVCIGFLLFFGCIGVLAWNEGRTVRTARDLAEGRENVMEIPLWQATENAGEMTLIHTNGETSTPDIITDPVFGVSASSLTPAAAITTTENSTTVAAAAALLKLTRAVSMYQWKEVTETRSEKTSTGGTRKITDYSYEKTWSNQYYDSSEFGPSSNTNGNPIYWNGELVENPQQFPFQAAEWQAEPILLGNLTLSDRAVDRINTYQPVQYVSLEDVPNAETQASLRLENNGAGFYYGTGTSAQPQIGDTRITWVAVPTSTISVIGEVSVSNELVSWTTSRMGELLLVEPGIQTAGEMFTSAENANTTLAWILRFAGFIVMVISITLMLQPLSTALDIIPFVGGCVGDGMESCLFPLIGCIISLPIALFVIGLAWIWHRPLFGIPLASVCGATLCFVCYRVYTTKPSNSATGTVPSSKPADHAAYEQQPAPSAPPTAYAQPYGQQQQPYQQQQVYKPSYGEQEIPVATAQPVYGSSAPTGGFANALDP